MDEMSRREALSAEQQQELQTLETQAALLAWALKHGVPHFENNDLEVPYEEQSQTLQLVKEAGGWKVNYPDK
ncbi:MAG: hypothetical protein IGS03_04440 [Candidatus Sericytochromatia bacterium]|nr:hypothetical protein [Candidatus Sericytochromatia bacterium]